MSNLDALDMMATIDGQFDADLLRAFRGFVLDQGRTDQSEPQIHVA